MIGQDQFSRFNHIGFLDGGTFLSADEVEDLRHELDRVIARSKTGFAPGEPQPVAVRSLTGDESPVIQVINIWQASRAFERLAFHPQIVSAISRLSGLANLHLYHDQVVFKPPRHGGIVRWHQDAPFWLEITPPTPVSAWVAMDDVDEENGCMWMVPGSHGWEDVNSRLQKVREENFHNPDPEGFAPPQAAQRRDVNPQARPVTSGGVLYHHSYMWHASHANRSDRPRRAIAIHYVPGDATFHRIEDAPAQVLTDAPEGTKVKDLGQNFPCVCRDGRPVRA